MTIREIDPKKDLIFDMKVVESCKSCKRYGLTGCCPPNIGSFEYYKKLLKRYKYGKLFIESFMVPDQSKKLEIGRESSLTIHKALLEEREKLFNDGCVFNVILSGGSCKWCSKCSVPCKTPQYRAIPIEATGINVIETLYKLGLFINFPVKSKFYRVGVILYDR